jgi:hypothetical protein
MHLFMHLSLAFVLTAWTTCPASGQGAAQDSPPATAPLPAATVVLDRHVEATGGKEAHLCLTTRRLVGKLAIDMAGHVFDRPVQRLCQAPGTSHIVIEGIRVTASNGEAAWEWQPGDAGHGQDPEGPGVTRLLEGDEKSRAIERGQWRDAIEWRSYVQSAKTIGREDVGGRPALAVEIVRPGGTRLTQWFDAESGLMIKYAYAEPRALGHLGLLDQTVYLEDYQQHDGVWLPMQVRVVLSSEAFGEGTQVWTYTSVEHGVKIPASLFEVPAELAK